MYTKKFTTSLIVLNLILLTFVLAFVGIQWAKGNATVQTAPQVISYQGVLTDSNGNLINGTRDLIVAVYATETGGTAIWSETHPGVVFDAGAFNILLGSVTPLPSDLFDQPDRWLEMTVDGVTLTPRQQFASVPYALNADKVDGLDASELLTVNDPETWYIGNFQTDPRTGIMRSDRVFNSWPEDTFNNFPPPWSEKTVKSTSFYIPNKSGSYDDGIFTLVFEIRDFAGNLQHTVSAESIDFSNAEVGTWVSVPLSSNPDDLVILPGEYLGIHVHRTGPQSGDLWIDAVFRAKVGLP